MREYPRSSRNVPPVCSDAQCERPATRRGLCNKHYMRQKEAA